MQIVLIAALVFGGISFALAYFLGTEFLKKFRFMRDFMENSNMFVSYCYCGISDITASRAPGMRNIVLRSLRGKSFSAIVGFRLGIPVIGYEGFDYYGFVKSDEHGVAVLSTYLGRGACEFVFLVNCDLAVNPIGASSTDADQALTPSATYPPHWYQRIGFYG